MSGLPQIIQTRGVPIHLYADEIEPQAMEQVKLLAESPIPVDYVSVMPDAHLGKGVTIGTVFASEKYVCPNAVGVDIGCGMAAKRVVGCAEVSQRYAFENRKAAMQRIMLEIISDVTGCEAETSSRSVNIHHNYCQCEDCNGRKLYVTRKGATSAAKGQMGIIPGSMGSGSYITRGKGDIQSWNSSSHGAGRRMSRTKAHASIDQGDFEEAMAGVVCDTHPSVRDEAPQAYKDLGVVMEQQASLTEIVHRLLPLINVKGYEEKLPRRYRKRKPRKRGKCR
ncbi:hypothetical protein ACHAXT_000008 [Thalassiosira profunda]